MVELLLASCNENKEIEKKVPCDFCTENSGKRWCLECCHQFCSKCLIAHNNKPMHITVPIAERAAYCCNKHINEVMKLWCTYCKLPICSSCLVDDNQHSQHQGAMEPMYKIMNETRTSIETCLQQLDCAELNFMALAKSTVAAVKNQKDNYTNTSEDFTDLFRSLNRMIEDRKQTLSYELEDHQATILSRLHHIEMNVREQLHRIQNQKLSCNRICMSGNTIQLLETNQNISTICKELVHTQQELISSCTTQETKFIHSLVDMTSIADLINNFGNIKCNDVKTIDCPILNQIIISQPTVAEQRFYNGSFIFGYRFHFEQSIRLKYVLIQSTYRNNITASFYDETGEEQKQFSCESINDTFKWNIISTDGIELQTGHSLLIWSSDHEGSIGYQQRSSRFQQVNPICAVAGVTHLHSLTISYSSKKYTKYPQVLDQQIATHVVTDILYGIDLYFVFDRIITDNENRTDIQKLLNKIK
ncbi:unnamed protein product [Adineta steineri]|uniref:B box-type domain-containing protein n=1 Tax=Adineta steineri TaxID=433720 RepID=A0A814SDK6_9BILA|nr:unnamed protein product [Adineta steineri]CAF1317985.1 unnamed protein product [Adineta steineri]